MSTTASRSNVKNEGTTTKHAADAVHEAVDSVAERAERAEARIREAAADAQDHLHEGAQAARAQTSAIAGNMQTMVKEHPVASLGVAFLAGVILSGLMRR